MSPYTKNVLDVQNVELERQAKIAAQNRGAQAVRAGAFGGSRQAIENAEADRNLAMLKNTNQAQGTTRREARTQEVLQRMAGSNQAAVKRASKRSRTTNKNAKG